MSTPRRRRDRPGLKDVQNIPKRGGERGGGATFSSAQSRAPLTPKHQRVERSHRGGHEYLDPGERQPPEADRNGFNHPGIISLPVTRPCMLSKYRSFLANSLATWISSPGAGGTCRLSDCIHQTVWFHHAAYDNWSATERIRQLRHAGDSAYNQPRLDRVRGPRGRLLMSNEKTMTVPQQADWAAILRVQVKPTPVAEESALSALRVTPRPHATEHAVRRSLQRERGDTGKPGTRACLLPWHRSANPGRAPRGPPIPIPCRSRHRRNPRKSPPTPRRSFRRPLRLT